MPRFSWNDNISFNQKEFGDGYSTYHKNNIRNENISKTIKMKHIIMLLLVITSLFNKNGWLLVITAFLWFVGDKTRNRKIIVTAVMLGIIVLAAASINSSNYESSNTRPPKKTILGATTTRTTTIAIRTTGGFAKSPTLSEQKDEEINENKRV